MTTLTDRIKRHDRRHLCASVIKATWILIASLTLIFLGFQFGGFDAGVAVAVVLVMMALFVLCCIEDRKRCEQILEGKHGN